MPSLVLASSSPRRSALLSAAGIAFVLGKPGPEPTGAGTPIELAVLRARAKAVHAELPAGVSVPVLGVDTVVDVDGRELGKPRDRGDAAVMLRQLCGRMHRVHTAHCLFDPGSGVRREEVATATVACRAATAAEIDAWLDRDEWRGKAGAYGIQDDSQSMVRLTSGAFDTVVGLHVDAVRRLLRALADA
jgi:nucleoside triphosphate pyrophosphatase